MSKSGDSVRRWYAGKGFRFEDDFGDTLDEKKVDDYIERAYSLAANDPGAQAHKLRGIRVVLDEQIAPGLRDVVGNNAAEAFRDAQGISYPDIQQGKVGRFRLDQFPQKMRDGIVREAKSRWNVHVSERRQSLDRAVSSATTGQDLLNISYEDYKDTVAESTFRGKINQRVKELTQ